jgi:hypothetical protein
MSNYRNDQIDPVTGKTRASVFNTKAPPGKFRVVYWRLEPDGKTTPLIDQDFDDKSKAVAHADSLKASGAYWVTVFNQKDRRVYVATDQVTNRNSPQSVTRLSGQTDPMRRTGKYKRRYD